jgi:ATP-dependent RNA helicase DeaD
VLVPTRELAMQVAEAVHKYGRTLGVRVLPIYGGAPMGRQLGALERGVDVVVATPGRALDHIGRGTLRLDGVKIVVLDEADEMLDMGFEDELRAILEATPRERQTALFSATMAPQVVRIANAHLRDPARVEIAREAMTAGTIPKVRQTAYVVPRAHKLATLGRVLDIEAPTSAIVFCRTRTEVDELTESLAGRGWSAEALHGGMGQEARDRVMRRGRRRATA